jgi:glycerol uptake facilitator-like aquaporin
VCRALILASTFADMFRLGNLGGNSFYISINTIFNTTVHWKAGNLAPVAIALTLVFAILMGGPLTGASLNPARTLGPAIITGNYSNLSIYLIAPPLGSWLHCCTSSFLEKSVSPGSLMRLSSEMHG